MKHEIDADTNCNWCAFWKTPGHDGINGYWLSKFTSIHHRLAVEMNTSPTRNRYTRKDDKRKDHTE